MREVYIEKLYVKNVRQFEELEITFNKGFNFIAGPNGCGKTSILTCISHCFSYNNYEYSRFNEGNEFWLNLVNNEKKFKIGLGKNSVNKNKYRTSSVNLWNKPDVESGYTSLNTLEYKKHIGNYTSPLFIGSNRSIEYINSQGMVKEKNSVEKEKEYINKSLTNLYGVTKPNVKQWIINRYFIIEKNWALEEKTNWEHMISNLPEIAPFNSNFSYLRTERDLEPIFSIYGKECYLEELSSGFKAILSIIIDIFEWIETTNEPGSKLVTEAAGTVLIDELDLHLHPEWQFTLRNGLEKIFPNLQFIATTHSPHLLASAKENEIIIMNKNSSDDNYNLSPTRKTFSGWNTDQILSELMGVKSLENKLYEKLIKKAFEKIENKQINEFKEIVDELELICHPNDSIITVFKTKLASMEAKK
ncbi:AAA family ATPase [Aliarcobacter butzleri]|uniref:AAA family ATPase n=1 Tax=Aliarcobacter butzleri TaxID=28197 RepID=UPI00344F8F68